MAKIKSNSASVNSLNLKSTEPAPHLNRLVQAHDPAHQTTHKIEATYNAINLISTQATRVHKYKYFLSPCYEIKSHIPVIIQTIQKLHIPRHKYQLTLHSLSETQLIVTNNSKIGMKSIWQSAKINPISLISHQLGDIPQVFLKITNQK